MAPNLNGYTNKEGVSLHPTPSQLAAFQVATTGRFWVAARRLVIQPSRGTLMRYTPPAPGSVAPLALGAVAAAQRAGAVAPPGTA